MDPYLFVKLVHILSATVLFGTGIATAFFMLRAYRSGDAAAFCRTAESVVLADWWFTTPAVVLQLGTGLWLTARLGIPFDSAWFTSVAALFALVGLCWLPVVVLQIRVRDRLRDGATPRDCAGLMRRWVALGIPAFTAVVVIFGLMVYKPWLHSFP